MGKITLILMCLLCGFLVSRAFMGPTGIPLGAAPRPLTRYPFTPHTWNICPPEDFLKIRLAYDLIESRALIGKSEKEVVALLGKSGCFVTHSMLDRGLGGPALSYNVGNARFYIFFEHNLATSAELSTHPGGWF